MSFLKVNYAEAGTTNTKKEFEPIAEGDYEVYVTEAKIGKSKQGNDMITVTLTVRDDVSQSFQKRKVWDYLVYTDKAKFKLQQVAKALAIPEGTDIATIQDFAKAILYSPFKITIKHSKDEYNGETKVRESISKYSKSEQATQAQKQPDPFQAPTTNNNNSMPF